jgi:hypothetical protein
MKAPVEPSPASADLPSPDDAPFAWLSVSEVALLLGPGVTPENVRARIRRGTLHARRVEGGRWQVSRAEVERVRKEAGACSHCDREASTLVIVKYHYHERVEFALCGRCAATAEAAYGRQQGVLEVCAWPLHGEGWFRDAGG